MKRLSLVITSIFLIVIFPQISSSDTIEINKEIRDFGDWQVICEIDQMMNSSYCKVAAKFYENTAVITLEPSSKVTNQLILVIPKIKPESFVKIRVDKNDLIFSNNIKEADFGFIPLNNEQKNILFNQMQKGSFLYIRFHSKEIDKEITSRMDLGNFRKALEYSKSRSNNN